MSQKVCLSCACVEKLCVCKAVEELFENDRFRKLTDSLAAVEVKEKKPRCLACWFTDCRCKAGLGGRH